MKNRRSVNKKMIEELKKQIEKRISAWEKKDSPVANYIAMNELEWVLSCINKLRELEVNDIAKQHGKDKSDEV